MAGKPLKKPTGPKAPKKPTSRSKTGNAQCSEAASNWQLALRGKASLNPQTHATLGKCRALAAAKKGAGLREASGKYSAEGRAALEGRLQKRFDSDLVTQKSRAERLDMLLKQRKAKGPAGDKQVAGEAPTPLPKKPRTPQVDWKDVKPGGDEKQIRRDGALQFLRYRAKRQFTPEQRAKAHAIADKVTGKSQQAKPSFSLKSDSSTPGMTSRNQGSFVQSETAIERSVRMEQAAKPKPLSGQSSMFDTTTQKLAPTVKAPQFLTPRAQVPLRDTAKAIKQRTLARAENNSGTATIRTSAIMADPERFQYKMNTSGPSGVTDQFKETKTWNKELAGVVQVWKDKNDGKTYVVNGHHRYDLAQRLGVKSLNVQYIQAKDAAEARMKGALTNIAEGRGTSIDAAKFFRDQPGVKDWASELKSKGISLSERTASEGLALKNVAPKIWRDVVDEMTPISRAVAIGKGGLREEDQLKLYRKATEGNWTSGKTTEFATELKRAPLVKVGSGGLFGDDEFVNVAEHRAALADRLKTNLKSGKKLLGTVSRTRNVGKLEAVGNKIDKQASAAEAEAQDRALQAFDIERKYGSRTSMVLDSYASRLAKGEKIDKVYGQFEKRVSRALDRDMNAKPFAPRFNARKARLAAR